MRSRAGRIALLLAILPIGTGAAKDPFGSLAPEWHASADAVALVLGLGGGIAIVLGCFAGGWLADRIHKPTSYAVSCALGLVACVLAIVGHTAAATKINLFFAMNTLFTLGVLRIDGWAHDAWHTNGMLYTEALLGVAALVLFAWVAGKIPGEGLEEGAESGNLTRSAAAPRHPMTLPDTMGGGR